MTAEPAFSSVRALGNVLRSGEVTAVGLVHYFLDRLEEVGRPLDAVAVVTPERVLDEAALADAERGCRAGSRTVPHASRQPGPGASPAAPNPSSAPALRA